MLRLLSVLLTFLLVSQNSWSRGGGDLVFKNTFETCLIDLTVIQSGFNFAVTCDLDLQGQTITLADDVRLVFGGGSIRNGTLVMNGGDIDGDLLNTTLDVMGDTVLRLPEFKFHVERWNVIQGLVTQARAIENKDEMNAVITLIKRLGATEIELDQIDAYFYGTLYDINPTAGLEQNAILLPSDFDFVMSDNTFLRIQPSNNPTAKLLGALNTENITITGGHLIGDRYEHDYTPVDDVYGNSRDTHEYGMLIHLAGAHNVVIDDVNMLDSSGDGLFISGTAIRNTDGSLRPGQRQTEQVILRNSLLDNNRRNNISLVDGEFITLDGNIISDAGGGEQVTEQVQIFDEDGNPVLDEDGNPTYRTVLVASSAGTYPRSGIDMEAYRERTTEGELLQYEWIREVTIMNNQFINNEVSDLILYTTDHVLVEGNLFGNGISSIATFEVVIRNNVFENTQVEFDPASIGIIFTSRVVQATGEELNYDLEIYGNQINGFDNGVVLGGDRIEFHDNTVTDFQIGMRVGDLDDSVLDNNTYISSRPTSWGYWGYADNPQNTIATNETIDVTNWPILLQFINQANPSSQLIFDGCQLNSTANYRTKIVDSSHITIRNSQMNTEVLLEGVTEDIILENNTITPN